MTTSPNSKSHPDEVIALVLQGGGALGAYQGGAYEALAASGTEPNWLAGISIGAINAAIIAGNAPANRVIRLRAFWERLSESIPVWPGSLWGQGQLRSANNAAAAAWAVMFGLPAFFTPRPGALLWPDSTAIPSFYDTSPLRNTLEELVDFKRLNDGSVRLSVSAVDVETGNFVDFDNWHQTIGPEHIMASGALPPGFPAVNIEGRAYWDGGLVSNTPLRHVVESMNASQATIYQVDLFSARGDRPHTMEQVAERDKDIRYSSRTRMVTDLIAERHEAHRRLRAMAELLPTKRREQADVQALLADTKDPAIDLVHLIHRRKGRETQNKDFEFSGISMSEHWAMGHHDMTHSLKQLKRSGHSRQAGEFRVFDLAPDPYQEATP